MKRFTFIALLTGIALCSLAAPGIRSWEVDGITREALVHIPEADKPPLVFVFHGHGGSMYNAARSFRLHELWPEAAVVYMHGLPTPGQLTDPEGKKNGWNADPSDDANRDLMFFDAVYASLCDQIDTNRVFSTGHSNGGSFTYCLWAARGDRFAAVAPSAAIAGRSADRLQPKPVIHVAGKNDALVKYEWQERMIARLININGCESDGVPWHCSGSLTGTLYRSPAGTPVVTLISPGRHRFPEEAPALIVRFFQTWREPVPAEQQRRATP